MSDPSRFMFEHHHEQLVYRYDPESGLRAFIGVHNTQLGPGLGGTRLWHYDSPEDAMLDVLRLSEGMTYKAAVAGLGLGGGKSVIMADGEENDPFIREARFKAFGGFVDELGGRYIAAEDVGTKPADMVYIRTQTQHVVGMPPEKGGSGDPSPMTAFGVFRGMQALIEAVMDTDDFTGVRVAVQGLGKVGLPLATLLIEAGAIVSGADVDPDAIQAGRRMGVTIVDPNAIYDVPCDIFAPCALGASINGATIRRLSCKIIAGSANNQLQQTRHGKILHERGIVYGVDFVINSGGLINVATEIDGYDDAKARYKTSLIYDTIKRLLEISHHENIPTTEAAQIMANEALQPIIA